MDRTRSTTRTTQVPRRFYLYDAERNRFHEVKDGFTIGRDEGDLTFPDDDLMSRAHFRLLQGEKGFQIEDLGSKNRTRVNTYPIDPNNPRKLALHDLIGAGHQRFIFTNQNQYRPSPVYSNIDRPLLTPADPTVLLGPDGKPREDQPHSQPEEILEVYETIPIDPEDEPTQMAPSPKKPGTESGEKKNKPLLIGVSAFLVLGGLFYVLEPQLQQRRTPVSRPAAETTQTQTKRNAIVLPAGGPSYWEAYTLENLAGTLYLRNTALQSRRPAFAAAKDNIELLKRFLAVPGERGNEPFGEQPAMENTADAACSLNETTGGALPLLPMNTLIDEISAGQKDVLAKLQDEKAGPLYPALFNARLSTIRFPILDRQIEMGSAIIRCGDPQGKRFSFSQRRAALFHAMQARENLASVLLLHQAKMVRTLTDTHAQEAIKSARLSALIRGYRNLILQLQNGLEWLETRDGAAGLSAQTVVQLKDANSAFIVSLNNEIKELQDAYDYGHKVYPGTYPVIKPDALLQDSDLLFLSAY